MGTATDVREAVVTQAVVLPALPAGLLCIEDRRRAYFQAKGHALPAADYALWAFLVVTMTAWTPYLSGTRPDVDAALRWQLAAVPLALGLRWLVNLVNGFAAQNGIEALRADARARGALTEEQRQEYLRREMSFAVPTHR